MHLAVCIYPSHGAVLLSASGISCLLLFSISRLYLAGPLTLRFKISLYRIFVRMMLMAVFFLRAISPFSMKL